MNSVPHPEKPPDFYPPLSEAETAAIEILIGYGIDFAPAYIGRARPYLNVGHHDSDQPEARLPVTTKSAQQIVDYVMELIKFDEDQKLYLERRRKEKKLEGLYDQMATELPNSDPQTAELVKILRQEVERERFNKGWAPIEVDMFENHDGWPDFIGALEIGGKKFFATAFWTTGVKGKSVLRVQIKPE